MKENYKLKEDFVKKKTSILEPRKKNLVDEVLEDGPGRGSKIPEITDTLILAPKLVGLNSFLCNPDRSIPGP